MIFHQSAVSVEERHAAPAAVQYKLPRRYRRLIVILSGIVLGALLALLYLFLMVRTASPATYVIYGVLGGLCGFVLVAIPRLIWHFLRKQAYRLVLRQWTDKSAVLATAARRELQDEQREPQVTNDLAVVDFLQRDYARAAEGFATAAEAGAREPEVNLPAALAETAQWARLTALLHAQQATQTLPGAMNLARLAAYVPDQELVERLWNVAQTRLADNRSREGISILLNNLGVRALTAGRFPQASRALELALEYKPGYDMAHANLGVLAYREGDLKRAISETASAAGLTADDAPVFANLGALLSAARDWRAGESWLLRAHRLEPRNAGVLVNLGTALHAGGRHPEAVTALGQAINLTENSADRTAPATLTAAHYNLALVKQTEGELGPALEHLQKAAAVADKDLDVLTNLGCVLFLLKRHEPAYAHFKQVASLSSEPRYRRNLIRAELGAGRTSEAAGLLDQEVGETGADELALEGGILSLLRALQIKPESETHRQMIDHNLVAAANAFNRVSARGDASAVDATFNLGLTQYARGEFRTAGESLGKALHKHGAQQHPEMHYVTGVCYLMAATRELEQHQEVSGTAVPPTVREYYLKARPYLEKVMDLTAPGAGADKTGGARHKLAETAAYDLALLNYMVGDYQKAVEVFKKIVRSDSPPPLLNAMAIAQARLAQELLHSAQTATLMPEGRKQSIRQQARGLLAGAIFYFNQALQSAPEAPLTHANMGLALMLRNQRGDVEAALNHWQLMHKHGDERARRTYEEFMQAVSPDAAQKLRFQDVELVFRPLNVAEWIVLPRPQMSGPRYLIKELLDVPDWQLQAYHRRVQRALAYRRKAERVRRKLRSLAI